MQETRKQVLSILQRRGEATIRELASAVNVTIGTVRHHMAILEREGWVTSRRMRNRVGRPRLVFCLSEQASERFPKRYGWLSIALMNEVKNTYGTQALESLLVQVARHKVTERIPETLGDLPLKEKIHLLIDLYTEEGFAVEWALEKDGIQIQHHACPYLTVASRHPEVCLLDIEIMRSVTGANVEREACVLSGNRSCIFSLQLKEQALKNAHPALTPTEDRSFPLEIITTE
ncbi:MAG: winged helix-turn-helix transcriptional regulator [Anaerolineales bacterium]|nr:winged helix-turn-helix transcriptional regulator [Anaerolineales bacterium]